jgi:hypothetical protein
LLAGELGPGHRALPLRNSSAATDRTVALPAEQHARGGSVARRAQQGAPEAPRFDRIEDERVIPLRNCYEDVFRG